jgi:hypothetical protein
VPEGVAPVWMNVYNVGFGLPERLRSLSDEMPAAKRRVAIVRIDGWDDDGNLIGKVEQP